MITTAIVYVIYAALFVLTAPLRLFADVVLPTSIASALTTVSGYLGTFNQFIPVGTLIGVFAVLLSVEIYILAYKGFKWIINKIPGVN
jgi:hypothetical protein